MALMPKRVKYRKSQRGKIRGKATRGNTVAFGLYGLQALEPGWITAQQIEAARITLNRFLGGQGRYWIRIFPHKSVTATPAETRMGKGKGEIDFWCAVVKPGTVLFEIDGVNEELAREAFRRQSGKFPVRCKMIKRRTHA
jgi:large subunit ribosomal protein L16